MKIGDAVPAKSIRVMVPNGWLNYKAPEGEHFVFLLLGTQPIKGDALDPNSVLSGLGWQPVSDNHDALVAMLTECRKQVAAVIDGHPTEWAAWLTDIDAALSRAEQPPLSATPATAA